MKLNTVLWYYLKARYFFLNYGILRGENQRQHNPCSFNSASTVPVLSILRQVYSCRVSYATNPICRHVNKRGLRFVFCIQASTVLVYVSFKFA
jgi:hypothetical protein